MEEMPRHDLLAGADALAEQLDVLAAAAHRTWSLSDAEVRDGVEALARLQSRLAAVTLAMVRTLDGRPDAVGGA